MIRSACGRTGLLTALASGVALSCAPAWETGELFCGRTVSAWVRVIARDEDVLEPSTAATLWEMARVSKGAPRAFARVLGTGDEDERLAAIRAVEEFALVDKGVRPLFIEALRDPSESNRGRAEAALRRIEPAGEEDMDRLVADLASGDATARLYAAFMIGKAWEGSYREPIASVKGGPGSERGVVALAKALSDSDRDVRRYAALALAEIGEAATRAAPEITAALGDPYAPVRAQAARALGRIHGEGNAPGLVTPLLFEHPGEEAHEAAAAERDAAVLALLPLLEDPSAEVREAATGTLSYLAPENALAVQPLARALADSNEFVRLDAANALQEMGALARPAIPALTRALLHADRSLRRSVAGALAATINPDDVPPDAPKLSELDVTVAVLALAGALRDEEEFVRDAAVEALADIGPRARAAESALAERFERSALDGSDVRARLDIAKALESVSPGSKWTVGAFRDLLGETRPPESRIEDEDIGRSAAWALARKGRSVLGVLKAALASAVPHTRASAAAGLGWLARGRRLAPGSGFSDVPIGTDDPDAPRALDAEETARVVETLTRALGDADAGVRAAAAQALGDVGAAAAPAFDAVVRALGDAEGDVRAGAVWALEGLGPRAAPAVPLIIKALKDPHAPVRAHAVMALGTIAPERDEALLPLADALADESYDVGRRAATLVAQRGPAAVPPLVRLLRTGDRPTRANAAYALALMGKEAVAAGDALIDALGDEDPCVLQYSARAVSETHPDPARAVPALLRIFREEEGLTRDAAAWALASYGPAARTAVPALVDALAKGEGHESYAPLGALAGIGPDEETARRIASLELPPDWGLEILVLKTLVGHPGMALGYLEARPGLLSQAREGADFFAEILSRTDAEGAELRRALRARDDLPAEVMVRTGDRAFLPVIGKRMEAASQHRRTFLAACARALAGPGSPGERVVRISETEPGEFRPPSYDSCDRRRMPRGTGGHGDGETEVVVTGRLLMPGGKPAFNPRLFDLNDRWLLGQRRKDPAPITYDLETGRFVYVTSVFAAYASGEGPREPGPYHTGSALVLIEADGAKALRVQFFDEMPDVELTLSRAE